MFPMLCAAVSPLFVSALLPRLEINFALCLDIASFAFCLFSAEVAVTYRRSIASSLFESTVTTCIIIGVHRYIGAHRNIAKLILRREETWKKFE